MAYTVSNDAKVIGESSLGFGQSNIIKLSSGKVYAAFINSSNEVEIYYRDTTGGFIYETKFTESNIQPILSLCVNNSDEIFLCYKIGTNGFLIKKRNTEGTWSEVLNDSISGLKGEASPVITINNTLGRLYFLITYVTASTSARHLEVRYSDNEGSTWNTTDNNFAGHVSAVDGYIYGAKVNESSGLIYAFIIMYGKQFIQVTSSIGTAISTEGIVTGTLHGGAFDLDSNGDRYQLIYRENSGTYYLEVNVNGVNLVSWSDVSDWIKHGMVDIRVDYIGDIYVLYAKRDGKIYQRIYDLSATTWSSEIEYDDGYRPSVDKYANDAILQMIYYQVG